MIVAYDLGYYPITFDFVYWLLRIEEARQKQGEDTLHIVFQPGDHEGFRGKTMRDFQFTSERKTWRLYNLLVPLAYRLQSVSAVTVSPERLNVYTPHFNPFKDAHRSPLTPFRASDTARDIVNSLYPDPYVTITVRDSDIQQERNTDQLQWSMAANWLHHQGKKVVVVPDTEAMLKNNHQRVWDTECQPAAMNPDIRLALYELADFNCFTSGGPMTLAQFSGCRYVTFGLRTDGIQTCEPEYLEFIGLPDGATRGDYRESYWRAFTYMHDVDILERFLKIESNRDVRPVFDAQTHYRGHLIQPVAHG